MGVLSRVDTPEDVRRLNVAELRELAEEIREFLVRKVAATGGHLGPNLGVVELTIALHRVFDSPADPLIFDTGHQAYVHKILTGRKDRFDDLRKQGGLSGYPSRAESPHDWVESSHASAALSYADGLAKAFALGGQDRHVVAVVGDGALTGGMCWEALNNIAAAPDRPVVVVVNDNGRSYAPTIGGLADRLTALRTQPAYEHALDAGKRLLKSIPRVGESAYSMVHAVKAGIKDAVSPQELFSDLGLKYVGPVDGHDVVAMESALRRAKDFGGPVVVHAVTQKGRGYEHAENHVADQMHACDPIDPLTGRPLGGAKARGWTSVFSEELIEHARRRSDIVAITAAMPGPTGLSAFGERFPDRMFDVGIAEQHAMASAAGLALGGMHPVVAIYSTFLNRAFDQLLMDVALLKQPVTVVLDRAGITGPDGASHNGMWDLSLLGIIPGIRVAAPRDAATLREELGEALAVADGPTVLRFPKGSVAEDLTAVERIDGVDVLRAADPESAVRTQRGDVLIVAVGPFARIGLAAAELLAPEGVSVTVVDPRWVLPVSDTVVKLAENYRLVVTLEDSGLHGGIGSTVSARLRSVGLDVPTRDLGVPQQFLDHASRDQVLEQLGLTPTDVARRIAGWLDAR
ncbi:1-deoxy-D-xylulose-5-phosphate synthase [Nocardia farcinica]|uniref:1-deoxy-D-xylulose-5-phosphate synthase n=1 Tax=Nocardia farcinica TaxID=37329 RepID=UPI0018956D10|nr:1-deoxy-D-xylulose-5-phosphate synthase [Nocardia farcinica]MBF6262048.1 1-deoxy-D-xylulose-5-phosphate synthase [Nocardia farcinica]MBF6280587.1 1-deoxy-D-xylulose-5-phosphate synthase [Nocardia farcinica]MBF6304955.1 1-deoxy-D-xylulose-5-phosphate synthase [Nocardia farcinica]MBF6390439.1 1-deoxy-D-xylulose-5-phosphate synthase [Nocardia farcinica]MBF6494502.1 1-deoxy-D-xylulose-5-phosphate synthase [Nocardia farcinica]